MLIGRFPRFLLSGTGSDMPFIRIETFQNCSEEILKKKVKENHRKRPERTSEKN